MSSSDLQGDTVGSPVEDLVEEYLELLNQDSPPTAEEFANRYPNYRGELLRVLETFNIIKRLQANVEAKELVELDFEKERFPAIEDYQILRIVGRGGMGIVYEAQQQSLQRRVALKVLAKHLCGDRRARNRFQVEACAAAKLHHTNIVPVFEVGCYGEECFFAMQFIEGDALDKIIWQLKRIRNSASNEQELGLPKQSESSLSETFQREVLAQRSMTVATTLLVQQENNSLTSIRPPIQRKSSTSDSSPSDGPLEENASDTNSSLVTSKGSRPFFMNVAKIGWQIAMALQHAHGQGIIHRDIKPSNLMIDLQGNAWITDFGLAKTDESDLTRDGDVIGTIRYMSPERFNGDCDPSCDVYSLGATLYELISLQAAFGEKDRYRLIEQIKTSRPKSLRKLNRKVPFDLQTIVEKAMEPQSSKRYSNAQAMAEDLYRFMHGQPIRARRVTVFEHLWLWSTRNPMIATMTMLILFGIMSVAIAATIAAFKFRDMANKQNQLASQANAAKNESIRNLFYAETVLVAQDLESPTSIDQVRDFIKRWTPTTGIDGTKSWEWAFLSAIANGEQDVIDLRKTDMLAEPWVSAALDYHPNGEFIAFTANYDVIVQRDGAKAPYRVLEGQAGFVWSVKFSHSGKLLATASDGGALIVWDWENKQIVKQLQHPVGIGSVCWHPNDNELVFLTNEFKDKDSLHVVDFESFQIKHSIDKNMGQHSRKNDYSKDGKYFCAALGDFNEGFSIAVFETAGWNSIASKKLHTETVYAATWHPDCQTIASSGTDGTACVWNFKTDESKTIIQLKDGIPSVAWSPSGESLVVCGWDNSLRIWDKSTGEFVQSLQGNQSKVRTASWHPDGNNIVSLDFHPYLRTWNLAAEPPIQYLRIPPPPGMQSSTEMKVNWRPDGKQLAVGNGVEMYVWDRTKFKLAQDAIVHQENAFPEWSPDAKFLASYYRSTMSFWNQDVNVLEQQFELPPETRFIAWQPDGRGIYITELERNGACYIWSLDRDAPNAPTKLAGPFTAIEDISISPSGEYMAVCLFSHPVFILDLKTNKIIKHLEGETAIENRSIVWSGDGTKLMTAGNNRVIDVWVTDRWEKAQSLSGHSFTINKLSWNASQHRLASASRDKTVRVWDTRTFRNVITLQFPTEVNDLQWSPDGSKLAAIGIDGTIKIWNASNADKTSVPMAE